MYHKRGQSNLTTDSEIILDFWYWEVLVHSTNKEIFKVEALELQKVTLSVRWSTFQSAFNISQGETGLHNLKYFQDVYCYNSIQKIISNLPV